MGESKCLNFNFGGQNQHSQLIFRKKERRTREIILSHVYQSVQSRNQTSFEFHPNSHHRGS